MLSDKNLKFCTGHLKKFLPSRLKRPKVLTNFSNFSKFSSQYLPELQSERAETQQSIRTPTWLLNQKLWWPWDVRCVNFFENLPIFEKVPFLVTTSGVVRQRTLSIICVQHLAVSYGSKITTPALPVFVPWEIKKGKKLQNCTTPFLPENFLNPVPPYVTTGRRNHCRPPNTIEVQ